MGTMGLFVVSLHKHNAIRLLSFLCLYGSLISSVVWSVWFRNCRCALVSSGLLLITVLGHSIMSVSIRTRLILVLLLVDLVLLTTISAVALFHAIRVNGSVVAESRWVLICMCLAIQLLLLVLVEYGVQIPLYLSIFPALCLFALSIVFHLGITVIRSLRVMCQLL